MLVNFFLIIFCGFILSILLLFSVIRFSLRNRVLVKDAVPFSGGLAIGLAFLFSSILGMFLLSGSYSQIAGIVISCSIMLIFGVIDDLKELSIFNKFVVEIIATAFLVLFGVRTNIAYVGNTVNIIITFIWVIGITNAVNHLDVMDGVAAGISLIASLAFLAISFLVKDTQVQIIALALIGSVSGFLILNYPPAKIYMGNSGSHFLGFILAAISMAIGYTGLGREIALLSPLLILGFPIFDTAFLIVVRAAQGRSALKKSDDHLALRFLRLGFSKRKTLLLMLVLSICFSFAGVFISRVTNTVGILFLVSLSLLSFIIFRIMGFKHA